VRIPMEIQKKKNIYIYLLTKGALNKRIGCYGGF